MNSHANFETYLGCREDTEGVSYDMHLDGKLDEVRISDVCRTEGYMISSFNTINNRTGSSPYIIISGLEVYNGSVPPVEEPTDNVTNVTLAPDTIGNHTYIMIALLFFFVALAEYKDDIVYFMICCLFALALGIHLLSIYATSGDIPYLYGVGVMLLSVYFGFLILINLWQSYKKRGGDN